MIALVTYLILWGTGLVPAQQQVFVGTALFDLLAIGMVVNGFKESGDTYNENNEYYETKQGGK